MFCGRFEALKTQKLSKNARRILPQRSGHSVFALPDKKVKMDPHEEDLCFWQEINFEFGLCFFYFDFEISILKLFQHQSSDSQSFSKPCR
mgnify:CR=1 FL=1